MPQIITKLSDRRTMKAANKNIKEVGKLIDGLGPKRIAEIETTINEAGLTAQEYAEGLIRGMIAEDVKTYTAKHFGTNPDAVTPDGFTRQDFLDGINGQTIEDLLEALVEGDLILDDADVHAFHRRKLDELRASVDNVRSFKGASLSYDAINTDFETASEMMDRGVLDKASQARAAHIRIMFDMMGDLGHEPTDQETEMAFHTSRVAVMVASYDDHGMTVEEIAEALDGTVEDVTECLASVAAKGLRSTRH
jgi:hypothetical protein